MSADVDYDVQTRFRVRFVRLGPGWISGCIGPYSAEGSTEEEVITRLREVLRAANWRPPSRKRYERAAVSSGGVSPEGAREEAN